MAGDIKVPGFDPGGGSSGGTSSGSSSGGGSSGGGGGTSSQAAQIKQKQLNRYLDLLVSLGLSANALTNKLARQAVKGGHSNAWFIEQVRQQDRRYLKTNDFKNRMANIWSVWQREMGQRPMPRKWALGKALSAMPLNSAAITRAIRKTTMWKQAYRGINLDLMTPAEFRQWAAAYNQISVEEGRGPVTPQEQYLLFSNNVAPADYEKNLALTHQGKSAYQWFMGRSMDPAAITASIFGGAGKAKAQSQLIASAQRQQGFAKSEAAGYDVSRRDRDRTLTTPGI
jgi:hypothetical protein